MSKEEEKENKPNNAAEDTQPLVDPVLFFDAAALIKGIKDIEKTADPPKKQKPITPRKK